LLHLAARLANGVATLFAVAILVFVAMQMVPGGYADIYLGPQGTLEDIQALEAKFGLDQPLYVQLGKWLANIATGNFGISLQTGRPVSEVLVERLPVTIELSLLAMLIAMIVALPIGLFLGLSGSNRVAQDGLRVGSALSVSIPDFVSASVVVYILSLLGSDWLSIGRHYDLFRDPLLNLKTYFFPALTLSLFAIAILVRTLRDSVQTVLAEPYIAAALLRGEGRWQIVRRHVLRNSRIPALAVASVSFGSMFGGAVIIETIYGLPGLGQSLVTSIEGRDYALVQAIVFVGAAAFIVVSIVADLLYAVIDPRLRSAAAS
jgi:peptide/nickel transport system permease protein